MLFLAGLESMSRDETVALLAQLNAVTPSRAVGEWLQKTALRIKDGAIKASARGAGIFSPSLSDRIESLKNQCDWDPNVIRRNIEEETLSLSKRTEPALKAELRKHLFELGKVKTGVDDAALAQAVILRAAESLQVPNAKHYTNTADLENAVFEEWLKRLLEQLRELSLSRTQELEEQLRSELAKLSEADREAIRKALNLERLSAETMISILKAGGGTLAGQTLVSGFGFGAYLFLATTLKAVGLLCGTSFAFGTYAAASSSLAFLLSPPFFLLVVAATGGVAFFKTWSQLEDHKAQLLVVIGRSQLLTSSKKRANGRWFRRILQWLSVIWRKIWTWIKAWKTRHWQGTTS